jgi:alpha-galactosidase
VGAAGAVSREAPAPLWGPPRIGLRRGRPFVHLLSIDPGATSTVTLDGLPPGMAFDRRTRVISGRTRAVGSHPVRIRADGPGSQPLGSIELVVGEEICLTPPLGWNSWNAFGPAVTEDDVRRAAAMLIDSGLAARGWTAVNIDDGWQGDRDRAGRLQANEKFRDLRELCADLHRLGLRVGIYSSPGPTTCAGFVGSGGHEAEDARSFGAWGFDYLKYDWCSAGPHRDGLPLETLIAPYAVMRGALDAVDRDIVYHLCQYGMGEVWRWARERVGANAWRTTGDIVDTWESVAAIGFGQTELAEFAGPGGWNDPDMLVLGRLGGAWNRPLASTRLHPVEEQTHLVLWVLLAAPLLLGCDLTALKPPTLELLANPELIAIHQDRSGHQARRVRIDEGVEVWHKSLADGSSALGIFNRRGAPADAGFEWAELGIRPPAAVRDVIGRLQLPAAPGWHGALPAHGSALLLART